MLSALLSFLAGFLAKLASQWLADRRSAAALEDLGRAQGAAETSAVLLEIADDQARINAAPRGDARAVGERLRDEARRLRARGDGGTGVQG